MPMLRRSVMALGSALGACSLSIGSAQAGLITFEEITVPTAATPNAAGTDVLHNGGLVKLIGTYIQPGQNPVTITISRRDNAAFDIIDNNAQSALFPPGQPSKAAPGDDTTNNPNGRWEGRSFDPFSSFNNGQTASSSFIIEFSQPIFVFSTLVGDFGDSNPSAGQKVGDTDIINLFGYTGAIPAVAGSSIKKVDSLAPTHLAGDPTPFGQKRVTLTSSVGMNAVEVIAGGGSGGDLLSTFLDRMFFDFHLGDTVPADVESAPGDNIFGGPVAATTGPYAFDAAHLSLTLSGAPSTGTGLAFTWDTVAAGDAHLVEPPLSLQQSGLSSVTDAKLVTLTVTDSQSRTSQAQTLVSYADSAPINVSGGGPLTFSAANLTVTGHATSDDPDFHVGISNFDSHTFSWSTGNTPDAADNVLTIPQMLALGIVHPGQSAFVHVIATDRAGLTAGADVLVTYQNTAPTATAAGSTETSGTFHFSASFGDVDASLAALFPGVAELQGFEALAWEFDAAGPNSLSSFSDGFLTGTGETAAGDLTLAQLESFFGSFGTFNVVFNVKDLAGATASFAFTLTLTDPGDVHVPVVPEPASALGLLALSGLLLPRRRPA
jgi:hypothetical protein